MIERYRIYAGLSYPFWWSTAVISKLSQPITSTRDLLVRICRVAVVIFLSPITLLLKCIAETILLFRAKPYTYKRGKALPNPEKNELSILNWNICGLPGGLPTWFGGVSALPERIDDIANVILDRDCDIVCLQEAHDVKGQYTLYEKLRHRYQHFYLNIGSKAFQHNSGLFVASKSPLSNISFTPFRFKGKQFGINKGYFCFDCENGTKSPLRIVTTHLQPYTSKQDQEIRLKELKEITMKNPSIVCGDLNIDRFSYEKGLDYIYQLYNDALGKVETATDSLNSGNSHQEPSSIDYCLLRNSSYTIQTRVIQAYDIHDSKNALSDHHALISSIHT